MIDIIIPTNKYPIQIKRYIHKVEASVNLFNYRVMPTCFQASAAVNRNFGLIKAKSEIVIMIDDDLSGFSHGWADKLVAPFKDPDVIMVSARLMKTKTQVGPMMSIHPDLSKPIVEVPDQILPSACIAFRNDGTRFDELNYEGAGYEDTDFCYQLNMKYPNGKFLINNDVKLIHKNEMKGSNQLKLNEIKFRIKWDKKILEEFKK